MEANLQWAKFNKRDLILVENKQVKLSCIVKFGSWVAVRAMHAGQVLSKLP